MTTTIEGPGLHTRRADGILQIRLPLVDNPIGYINAYLLEDGDGYTLVDCGWDVPEGRAALEIALGEVGTKLDAIRRVVITHYHADHYGMTGTLADATGAKVVMHGADWRVVDTELRDMDVELARRDAWLERHGIDRPAFGPGRLRWLERFTIRAPDHEVVDNDVLQIGSRRFRVIWTPGHSPGHICLFDEENSVVLTGDHVLADLAPPVSFWANEEGDPLADCIASLHKIAALGARTALPAHREPIEDLTGRCQELLAMHEKRAAAIAGVLAESKSALTAFEVAGKLPWRRKGISFDRLRDMERGFGLAGIIAHLEHLRAAGRVERETEPDVLRYRLI